MKTIIITSPTHIKNEAIICNLLFAHGLELLHLRKPDATLAEYEKFIQQISPCYRSGIVLHDHYELAEKYKLHGIHLKSGQAHQYVNYSGHIISISCHSIEEINRLPFKPAYCFLSPLFDSISKQGYSSPFLQLPDLSTTAIPVIALGGITPEKIGICRQKGFSGIAAIGYVWEKPEKAISRFMSLKTPFVLSIAGFDPSSGAGVTADLKTFEATGSYGLGICTALTFQNENTYVGTHWIPSEEIKNQCDLQFQNHQPEFVKIGLMENFQLIDQLTAYLSNRYPDLKIIWDPILKASAGYTFHQNYNMHLNNILKRIYLITPNTEELHQLFGEQCNLDKLQQICQTYQTNLLWKGGHNSGSHSLDILVTKNQIHQFSLPRIAGSKHGTGCVLSSAICSLLAQGYTLSEACSKAQLYVGHIIESNDGKLGFHFLHSISFNHLPTPLELPLQYITAPKKGITLAEQVEAVCRGGIRWVQLRMKGTSDHELLCEGRLIKEICRHYNALFIINDNVEVARQLDADGVHLGKEDLDPVKARSILGNGKFIGATCNTWEDIILRQQQQVDYIGLGPFAFTTTKEKLSPTLGLEGYQNLLKQMKENNIRIPVFAIGGITESDIPPLMKTGIQGIAVSGLIKNGPNMTDKTQEILNLINNSLKNS